MAERIYKIDEEKKASFARLGIVCLKGFISESSTTLARDAILRELTRIGLRKNGKWLTSKFNGISPFQVTAKIGQKIAHQEEFDTVIPIDLFAQLQALAGGSLTPTPPQILVTPPQKTPWTLPHHGWHVDISTKSPDRIPGIQVFVLLDEVQPHGGGTLALPGSHLSSHRSPSPDRTLEMSGRAGDVYLMDMRVLHAPSINASRKARMMLTSRYLAEQG